MSKSKVLKTVKSDILKKLDSLAQLCSIPEEGKEIICEPIIIDKKLVKG